MLVVSWANAGQLRCNARAVGHEPSRLQDWPKRGALAADVGSHAKLAHMGERPRNVLAGHELLDAAKAPAGCQVWVLVEEVPIVVDLVLLHLGAELDISFRLHNPLGT